MKKLILIACLLPAACQPSQPQEIPSVNGIDMQIGDDLAVTWRGVLSYTGGVLRCRNGMEPPTFPGTIDQSE